MIGRTDRAMRNMCRNEYTDALNFGRVACGHALDPLSRDQSAFLLKQAGRLKLVTTRNRERC